MIPFPAHRRFQLEPYKVSSDWGSLCNYTYSDDHTCACTQSGKNYLGTPVHFAPFIQTETVIDAYAPVGAFKNAPNGTYSRDHEGKAVWMEYAFPEDVPALMARWLRFFK